MGQGKYLLTLLISLTAFENAHCQLAPFQDEDALITPCFRTDVIKAKKISQITIHDIVKPDGETMKDDGIIHQYSFDTTGKLTALLYTEKTSNNSWDTVKCSYSYNTRNNLTIKRTEMGDFYDTWYYKWNKDNRMQSEYHVHENSTFSADGTFKISNQRVISSDSFAYISYPKQLQQYKFNEDNKIFQKTITQYDDSKRFISRSCNYAVSWLYSQVQVYYDSSGRITSYVNTGNLNGEMNKKTIIKYDSLGNITEESIWEAGKQTHHIEYMYDAATGLMTDKLDRDFDKATIFILRFSYIPDANHTIHSQETRVGTPKRQVSHVSSHKRKSHHKKRVVKKQNN